MRSMLFSVATIALYLPAVFPAQQPAAPHSTTAAEAPDHDTSYIDEQGTAHVTRVVPLPLTISNEARKMLGRPAPDMEPPQSLEQRRASLTASTDAARIAWTKICPNTIVEDKMAGVPVRIVTPVEIPAANRDKVFINIHGGGFNADSGSYSESIPIASYAGVRVVSVMYRLAPEHPFPAGVDDVIAVYKELLKTYKPEHIAIYGTSAGAVMTGEVAVKLKQTGVPLPAALGIFSGIGDFAHSGDTSSLFNTSGLRGHLDPPSDPHDPYYIGGLDPKDPVLSPMYADLHGRTPALFVSGTRDMLLSGTSNLHRAFLRAGDEASLVVFDAMPHAFWYNASLPESIEASHMMAAGNGGSASDAQHVAAEFVCRLSDDRPAMRAVALTTNTSTLTAAGNDYGFERIFARQIEGVGERGDIFLGISTSGNSANVVRALEQCRAMGIQTIGLTGKSGGKMAPLCDYCLRVPSEVTMYIQQAHLALEHIYCLMVERMVFGGERARATASAAALKE